MVGTPAAGDAADRDAPGSRPVALLVLGMHRSGTSAVARALNLCGVALGDALMPARADNPAGFWEHAEVVQVHDALLAALGMAWDDPRPMPVGWLDSDGARQAQDALEAIVRRDFAQVPLWAVKDPRLCRLVPLWRRMLAGLDIQVRALLVGRHPGEVAASLAARDGLAVETSGLLWARHLLDAVGDTGGLRRVAVDYDALLRDPQAELARIADGLDLSLIHI